MDHGFSPLCTSSEVNADDHGNWTQDLGGHTAMSEWNPMSWFREDLFYSFWLFWCYWIKPKGHVFFFVGDDEMTRLFLGRFLQKNRLSRNSVHWDPHDVKVEVGTCVVPSGVLWPGFTAGDDGHGLGWSFILLFQKPVEIWPLAFLWKS